MIFDITELYEKAKKVRLFLMDVDGVLTDGRIIYDSSGREIKQFHVRDGHGIKLLVRNGIEAGVITGRNSTIVPLRAEELGISLLWQGVKNKREVIETILAERTYRSDEIAFMGDDIVDIPVMRRVGFRVAVPDAQNEVRDEADYITMRQAGRGAVREACELILKAKGLWQQIIDNYRA